MRPIKVSIIHLFTIVISIGDAYGQQYEARLGGAPVEDLTGEGYSLSTRRRDNSRTYDTDFDAVRSAFQNTDETLRDQQSASGNRQNSFSRRPQHDCDNSDIAECVGLLEVLTNKDLGFAASVDELNNMCPVLLNGLQCIDNYTRRCLTIKHREYFNKLYAGTIRVIKDLCNTKGKYQLEYIRHAPCMRQVNPKYNRCSEVYHEKTADLNQINDAVIQLSDEEKNRNVITLCCSFQEYLQCSEQVVYETCGNETALFTKEFLDRMAGPIVQDLCQAFSFSIHSCSQESTTSTEKTQGRSEVVQQPPTTAGLPSTSQSVDRYSELPSLPDVDSDHAPVTQNPSAVTFTHGTTIKPFTFHSEIIDSNGSDYLVSEQVLPIVSPAAVKRDEEEIKQGTGEETTDPTMVQSPSVINKVIRTRLYHGNQRQAMHEQKEEKDISYARSGNDNPTAVPWRHRRDGKEHDDISQTAIHAEISSSQTYENLRMTSSIVGHSDSPVLAILNSLITSSFSLTEESPNIKISQPPSSNNATELPENVVTLTNITDTDGVYSSTGPSGGKNKDAKSGLTTTSPLSPRPFRRRRFRPESRRDKMSLQVGDGSTRRSHRRRLGKISPPAGADGRKPRRRRPKPTLQKPEEKLESISRPYLVPHQERNATNQSVSQLTGVATQLSGSQEYSRHHSKPETGMTRREIMESSVKSNHTSTRYYDSKSDARTTFRDRFNITTGHPRRRNRFDNRERQGRVQGGKRRRRPYGTWRGTNPGDGQKPRGRDLSHRAYRPPLATGRTRPRRPYHDRKSVPYSPHFGLTRNVSKNEYINVQTDIPYPSVSVVPPIISSNQNKVISQEDLKDKHFSVTTASTHTGPLPDLEIAIASLEPSNNETSHVSKLNTSDSHPMTQTLDTDRQQNQNRSYVSTSGIGKAYENATEDITLISQETAKDTREDATKKQDDIVEIDSTSKTESHSASEDKRANNKTWLGSVSCSSGLDECGEMSVSSPDASVTNITETSNLNNEFLLQVSNGTSKNEAGGENYHDTDIRIHKIGNKNTITYMNGNGVPITASPAETFYWWFQRRALDEVQEAVIPAPTPIPYAVRLHKEMAEEEKPSSNFAGVTLSILDSDFVPLLQPQEDFDNFKNGKDSAKLEKVSVNNHQYHSSVADVRGTTESQLSENNHTVIPAAELEEMGVNHDQHHSTVEDGRGATESQLSESKQTIILATNTSSSRLSHNNKGSVVKSTSTELTENAQDTTPSSDTVPLVSEDIQALFSNDTSIICEGVRNTTSKGDDMECVTPLNIMELDNSNIPTSFRNFSDFTTEEFIEELNISVTEKLIGSEGTEEPLQKNESFDGNSSAVEGSGIESSDPEVEESFQVGHDINTMVVQLQSSSEGIFKSPNVVALLIITIIIQ